MFAEPHRYDSAAWVAYRLAEIAPLPMDARQKLLEMEDPVARLASLYRLLASSRAGS
jgi:hypothetical protein